MPLPDRGTICGLPLPVSVNLRLPAAFPSAVGAKDTMVEHESPGSSVVLSQLLGPRMKPAPPAAAGDVNVTFPEPLLTTVTVRGALELPTGWSPNATETGDNA